MMQDADRRERRDGGQAGIPGQALPQIDDRADARIFGQVGIELRLVGMVQNVHDMRAAHAGRIVKAGILEAARLQVGDPDLGPFLHLVLGAEHDRLGRARLLACRSQPDRDAIGAQAALVGLVIDLGDARDVERTALHAIAAADAVLVHEIDDAVRVLHDRPGRRAGLEAARIPAMHAAVLADQPLEVLGLGIDPLGEAHHRPACRREIGGIVVDPDVHAHLLVHVVPFEAGDLAGLTADAFRGVDELRHLGLPLRRRRDGRSRATDEVPFSELRRNGLDRWIRKWWKHRRLPYATGPEMGSISTRNALNSGVSELASPTKGVSEFGPNPFLVTPVKPQWSGMPTMCTGLSSHWSGTMRLVTTAFAFTEPRFDHTRTQPPGLMPLSFASSSPISTKNSGCITAFGQTCLVQKWKCSVRR